MPLSDRAARRLRAATFSIAATLIAAAPAFAADGGAASPAASAKASSAPAASASSAPPLASVTGKPLPPGHPTGDAPDEPAAGDEAPHGHGGGGGMPAGMFEPTPDATDEDPTLPPGTIVVTLVDPDNKPLPSTAFTLGLLYNSVAKGESRKQLARETDAQGRATFDHLETGVGVAYRVSVTQGSATFAASPFQLNPRAGMRVTLHVYPSTRDVGQALIVTESVFYCEVKDDRVVIDQAFRIYNFGRTAWVPNDVVISLPPAFTALRGQEGMTDVGIAPVEGKGAKLVGTYGPGRNEVVFRWQLPYDNQPALDIEVGLPPHVAMMRVMAAAAPGMKLSAPGFPAAEPDTDNQGQRILVTGKQMRRDDPAMTTARIEIRDLPVEGPAKWIFLYAVGFSCLVGVAFGIRKDGSAATAKDAKARRALLLSDLEDLERAHRAGDIGPKTYERARRELIDAIARTLDKTAA